MRNRIYADNAATACLCRKAYEDMLPYLEKEYGNASQPYTFSRTSKRAIMRSREIIAECINAIPEEIYFTSCGTESDNWVIYGAIKKRLPIITSLIEHKAIIRPCEYALTQGHSVKYIGVNNQGEININDFEKAISEHNVCLASVMFANNEIGTIEPIKELSYIAHSHNALFHTDAVQALGHIPINVRQLGIDMLSASAHKFNGPKGIGFLYIKKGTDWPPLLYGGAQEYGMRAGTENTASIVGMASALKYNIDSITENGKHILNIEETFINCLDEYGIKYHRNGKVKHIPGNISLSFEGYNGEALLHRLDLMGISVSTGSACDSKETRISHVLKAINIDEKLAKGTIRISFGINNNIEDAYEIAQALNKILV